MQGRGGKGWRDLALSQWKGLLAANASDVTVLWLGDSTGNETSEFIYLLADWLGNQYPQFTVVYYINDGEGAGYDGGTTIHVGTGANTLHVYNASAGGFRPGDWMGDRYVDAVEAIAPDIVFFNMGANMVTGQNRARVRMEAISAIQQVLFTYPGTPIGWHLQPPARDDNVMEIVTGGIRDCQILMPELTLVNSYDYWIAAGKPSGWFADSVHPNATGQAEILATWQAAFTAARGEVPSGAFASWYADAMAKSVLLNGDFADFGGALPTSWTEGGVGTVSKDTVVKFAGKDYSVKVDGTNAKYLRQTLNSTQRGIINNRTVTLLVRYRVASGGASSDGRILGAINGSNVLSGDLSNGRDGFKFMIYTGISAANLTSFVISLYGTAAASAGVINIDSVALYIGDGKPA